MAEQWDSKGRPDRRSGKKVSGGHFFSPWESPSVFGRIRYGCGRKLSCPPLYQKRAFLSYFLSKGHESLPQPACLPPHKGDIVTKNIRTFNNALNVLPNRHPAKCAETKPSLFQKKFPTFMSFLKRLLKICILNIMKIVSKFTL